MGLFSRIHRSREARMAAVRQKAEAQARSRGAAPEDIQRAGDTAVRRWRRRRRLAA